MSEIRVWCGYRVDHKTEILWVVFDGDRLDALTYAPGGRTIEWTFYRTHDGRCVVQEVRYGIDCDLGVVHVFDSIVDACARFTAEFARVGADLVRVEEIPERRADPARVEPADAPVLTLDEFVERIRK